MKNTFFTVPLSMGQSDCTEVATYRDCRSFSSGREFGFTLMEVLVVLIIVGIMASIAIPSFSGFIANSRISSVTNGLISDLMLARSTASTIGKRVVVCPSVSTSAMGATCSTTVSDWSVGHLVFIDTNTDGIFDTGDAGFPNTPIKLSTGMPANLTVTMASFLNTYISYGSYGGMSPLGTGQFSLHITGASQGRQVSIDYSGRPSATKIP